VFQIVSRYTIGQHIYPIFPTGIYQRIESLDSFITLTGVDMFQELSLI